MTAATIVILVPLAAIAIMGVIAPLRRGSRSVAEPMPGRLDDRRAALLLALKDLEEARAVNALDRDEYERLRADTEGRLARLLRVLDERARDSSTKPAPTAARPRKRSPLRWGTAIGGVAVLLAVAVPLLMASVGQRDGLAFTGDAVDPATRSTDPLAFFEVRVQRNPSDVAARLDLAHRYLDAGRADDAIDEYLEAVQLDPDNAEANGHLGLLLYLSREPQRGLRLVERALEADPDYPEGLFFKGVILLKGLKRPGTAAAALSEYLRAAPYGSERDVARRLLEEARKR